MVIFFWNAGIFVWSVSTIIKEFDNQMPELAELLPNLQKKIDTDDMDKEILKVYSATKSILLIMQLWKMLRM